MRGSLNIGFIKSPCFLYLVCLLFASSLSFSQGEQKKWYFGSAAALDFVAGTPTPITSSSMSGYKEGSASVADAFGNLLFYTDGVTIWNKVDQVMANGSGLNGAIKITQSALIVKQPGTSGIYIVFTLASFQGLFYSVVDMNLAAGMGSVTVKNTLVSALSTEKLTGTKHCNGIDTWVVSHDFGTDVFRSVLVTSAGVSTTATLSAVGNTLSTLMQTYGAAKISQNGKKLGCAFYHNTPVTGNFELYDFDNSTGVVSNSLSLVIPLTIPPVAPGTNPSPPPPPKLPPSRYFPYGCEFSPDGSKFYGSGATDSVFYQWDLCAGSPADIISSRHKITSGRSSAMQLAKDGKIYVARINNQMIGVIQNPNLAGAACNYVVQGQSLGPVVCSYGLPNFIAEAPHSPFTTSINGAVNCNVVHFTAPPPPTATVTTCGSTGYNSTGFVWYFGDPASGAANTSTLNTPTHTYPGQGTYTASIVYTYNNSCGGVNTDTLKQEVKVGAPPLLSSAGFNLCSGNSLTLTAPPAQSYSWSTGVVSNSVVVSPSSSTSYTVSGFDLNNCPYRSTQNIQVYTTPTLTLKGDTTLCPDFQVKLSASGAATYSWSTSQTQPTIYPIQHATTTYTLWGNTNGCIVQKTITVRIKRPDVIAGPNVTVCPGTAVTLTAGGAVAYVWKGNIDGSTIVVTPTATTLYTVQGMDARSCINIASVAVTVETRSPTTEFYYKSPVCEKSGEVPSFTVSGFNGGGIFSSPELQVDAGTGAVNIASALAGTYVVTYTLAATGCTAGAQESATLEIVPGPVLSIPTSTTISPGMGVALEVNGASSYTWSPADYLSCVDCSSPIATPPGNMEYCVAADLNSCISNSCISIVVTCETNSDYSLPNAFTPNGDGTNDEYCLKGWGFCMQEFSIMIFDQWGELVFRSSSPDFCWDGVYKGRPLKSGVFVYVVSARKQDGTGINRKGNISLIR